MIYFLFYTDKFIKERFAGYTVGIFIFIRPAYKDDRGLLEHEKTHVRQNLNPRKWFMSKLDREVEAYKEQLKWYPKDSPGQKEWRIKLFAGYIATKYGLNITAPEAEKLLRG